MSRLRKVGAFLGLVPDEPRNRYDSVDSEYADSDYADSGYGDSEYGDSEYSDAEYADAGYGGVDYHGEYTTADGGADDAADYRRSYAGYRAGEYSGYGSDFQDQADGQQLAEYDADHEQPGYAYANAHTGRIEAYAESPTDADHRDTGRPAAAAVRQTTPVAASRSSSQGSPEVDYRTQGALAVQAQPRMETVADQNPAGKPVTVKVESFADARQVGEVYRDGTAVILDMTDLTDAEARRMVDFAAGLAFAVRGSIDKVTTKVFMLHPPTGEQL